MIAPATASAAATAAITKLDPQEVFTVGSDLVFVEGTGLKTVTAITVDGVNVDFADEGDGTLSFFTPEHEAGTAQVRLVTAEGTTEDNGTVDDLTYSEPPPVAEIASITPNSGPLKGGNTITIKGKNFTDTQGVVFGAFSLADDFTFISDTELNVVVPPGEKLGTVDLRVINLGGSNLNTATDDYTYADSTVPAPTVTGISPQTGSAGDVVTITGTNLTGGSVKFGDQTSPTVTPVSATELKAVVPPGARTVDVSVSTGAGASANTAADDFTYAVNTPAPAITSLSPASGPTAGGTVVTINGTSLGGATSVKFDGVPAIGLTQVSDTAVTAIAPPHGAGKANVVITTTVGPSADSAADDFTYVAPAPVITLTGLSPATGFTTGGTEVTITGTNLEGASSVTFGGSPALFTVVSPTQVKATAPGASAAGVVDVIVKSLIGNTAVSAASKFTYTVKPIPAPTVTAISPATGPEVGGTAVKITGTNLDGASAVTFGGTAAASITATSDTEITATSPAGTGSVDVAVTTPGGKATATTKFTYEKPAPIAPSITSISPASGPAAGGNVITITGENLAGASDVTIGGRSAAPITQVSATEIKVTAPGRSAGTVDIVVTALGGTSANTAADDYTYEPVPVTPPTIATIAPTSGPEAGGTVVTIKGSTLVKGVTTVTFGGKPGTDIKFPVGGGFPNQLTVVTPAGTGSVDVKVTTEDGSATATTQFKYDAPVVTTPEPTTPVVTTPEPTTPVVTTPEPTTPVVTTPEPTTPEVTTPEVTTPEVTTPEPTTPEVTTPEVTTPEVTTPEVTTPEVTTPEVTTPEVTTPEVTTPEVTTPEPTTPEVTTPEPTTPEVTTPEPTTPPVTTPPVITTPTPTTPVITTPPVSKLPVIRSLNPNWGFAYLGGVTTISGSNLTHVKSVKIGTKSAGFTPLGNSLLVFVPGQKKGKYTVTVTTAAGSSVASAATTYTYKGLF